MCRAIFVYVTPPSRDPRPRARLGAALADLRTHFDAVAGRMDATADRMDAAVTRLNAPALRIVPAAE